MTHRTRYGLIFAGFIFFLLAAPTIIYFVRGFFPSSEGINSVQTGLLDIKTEPKSAEVFLNNEAEGKSPETVRFLMPGQYKLELKKEGYQTWTKYITILTGKATLAHEGQEYIHLIKEFNTPTLLDTQVTSFKLRNKKIYYTSGNQLVFKSIHDSSAEESLSLKTNATISDINPSDTLVLLKTQSSFILADTQNKTVKEADWAKKSSKIIFITDSQLLSQNGTILELIDIPSNKIITLSTKVITFSVVDDYAYILNELTDTTAALYNIDLTSNPASQASNLLNDNLPASKDAQLLITASKAVYLFSDKQLLRIGTGTTVLANNVQSAKIDEASQSVIVITPGELHYVDERENKLIILNRNGSGFTAVAHRPGIGYFANITNGELKLVDTNTPDHQNQYKIPDLTNPKDFIWDNTNENLIILDENQLKLIKIK